MTHGRHAGGGRRRPAAAAIEPVGGDTFADAMCRLGPFEGRPHLAVAVSGGADSLALCLLAHDWAVARDGRITALTVDHGLRPASAAEARTVRSWLARLGIDHVILPWRGPKPTSRLQAAAREGRYALLTAWCRDAGVLHLLTAHHRGDQAETVLMRLSRDSGEAGLAGIAPLVFTPWLRILRPLLSVAPTRLRATLDGRGQPWIEDPSNKDPRFARTQARALTAARADDGDLLALAAAAATRRRALEAAVAALLATAATLHPAGFARIDRAAIAAAPEDIGRAALRRLIAMIGGTPYPPRRRAVSRLYRQMRAADPWRRATLGRCRIEVAGESLLISRELRNLPAPQPARPGLDILWDGRFHLALNRTAASSETLALIALGEDGRRRLLAAAPRLRDLSLPASAIATLPALADAAGIAAVPHLQFRRADAPPIHFTHFEFMPAVCGRAARFLVSPDSPII